VIVFRRERDRHPIRSYLLRTAGKLAVAFFILGRLLLLSGCACPPVGAYCPPTIAEGQ
jgi:hypothetical protein